MPSTRGAAGERLRVVAGRDRDHAARLLVRRQRGELVSTPRGLNEPVRLEELGLQERTTRRRAPSERRDEKSGVRWSRPPIASRAARTSSRVSTARHVSVYSGPAPPSGGVSRPPLAVIAPHWTQFDGVTIDLDLAVASLAPTS